MSSLEELRNERLKKRDMLVAAGMDPYASDSLHTHSIKQVLDDFNSLSDDETELAISGRVMSLRRHGGSSFADLYDGTGKIQVFFSRDSIGKKLFDLLNDAIDQSDFIEVKGVPFLTKRGAEALAASDWRVLTKTIQAVPSEHFGLKDEDERYRKRYLDILLNPELREIFEKKSKFWEATRAFMKQHSFAEVETPTLEITTGGAEARPFVTHHNDFDIDVYLRISIGELWQKRLMAAGYPRTFEIGRAYRNEGTSPEHLQEFSNMEFYMAYANYKDGMELVKEMYRYLAKEVFGTTKFTTRGHTFDLADAWTEIDYVEEIKKQTSINVLVASKTEMEAKLQELRVTYEGSNKERLTDTLWKYCRKNISGPAFLITHPLLVAPLAKKVSGKDVVEMFQPIIAGSEVGRGYSELNDPEDQRKRFMEQQKLLEAGDEEAMMPDFEFVEMLEYGMPPTCGFGFGERLFSFMVDKPLREVQLFPLMRPKVLESVNKKKLMTAVAVVANDQNLEPWQALNTVGHLAAELGAREGKSLLKFDSVKSKDGVNIPLNIQHAIMLKSGPSSKLYELMDKAQRVGLSVEAFTREMLETTNDNSVKESTAGKSVADIDFLGVMIFGPDDLVKQLTEQYPLYQ